MELLDLIMGGLIGGTLASAVTYVQDYRETNSLLDNVNDISEEELMELRSYRNALMNNKMTKIFLRGRVNAIDDFLRNYQKTR